MTKNEIQVFLSLGNETIPVGTLWCRMYKGKESASFEYHKEWLSHPERFPLEPLLKLTPGTYHTQNTLFGSIGDSAPDRWGRVLMRKSANHTLQESDYLLGVSDYARQGALRFAVKDNEYLATDQSIPPLVRLPKLLAATNRFVEDEANAQDLKLLLAPGSSLGGARPKASVIDKDGSLAIAKFTRKDDEYNAVLWEAVALTLAQRAKINVPKWRIERILDTPVLIINRFDRLQQERIPFLSSMSMLGAKDNEQHSYLEIAYALIQHGAYVEEDLEELWRRIVFSIMIANTDDHLRNHGFIYQRHKGWRLSPVYDINPTPEHIKPRILTTTIDFDNGNCDIQLALSVIKEFRISKTRAEEIIQNITNAVRSWREVADRIGLISKECKYMESAFAVTD